MISIHTLLPQAGSLHRTEAFPWGWFTAQSEPPPVCSISTIVDPGRRHCPSDYNQRSYQKSSGCWVGRSQRKWRRTCRVL